MSFNSIENMKFEVRIDLALFSLPVIYKTFNWFTAGFTIYFINNPDDTLNVILEKKDSSVLISEAELKNQISQYLIEYQTREIIHTETKNIRELIMVKAFSSLPDFKEEKLLEFKRDEFA
jgi:His-Xaa-Ser system protein HxsD